MTSCEPNVRDIWLAYVEFADHPGVGKVRPVVILDNRGKASVITAKVTSSTEFPQSEYVEITNWESCGLRRPSWVQINPLFEVRHDKLLRDAPLGQLPRDTFAELTRAYKAPRIRNARTTRVERKLNKEPEQDGRDNGLRPVVPSERLLLPFCVLR